MCRSMFYAAELRFKAPVGAVQMVTSLAFRAPRLRDSTASVDDLRFNATKSRSKVQMRLRRVQVVLSRRKRQSRAQVLRLSV